MTPLHVLVFISGITLIILMEDDFRDSSTNHLIEILLGIFLISTFLTFGVTN